MKRVCYYRFEVITMSNNYLIGICNRLYTAIEKSGLSYGEIADKTGIPKSAIHRYATGLTTKIPLDRLQAIARVVGTPAEVIMGWDVKSVRPDDSVTVYDLTESVRIPILGSVRAGAPAAAVEDILGYEEVTRALLDSGELFCLRIKGTSMEPRMKEGDVVIVRKQETVDNGEIAVVLINGDDATVKRFYRGPTGIQLSGINPDFEPIMFTPDQVDELPVRVLGKVIELRARF